MAVNDSDSRSFYVIAKNLSTSKVKILSADKINHVTPDRRYWPFKPQRTDDFERKTDYGVILNDKMTLHWIIEMRETEDQCKELLNDGRIKNPKRQSTSPAELPLHTYQIGNEKAKAKAGKKDKVAKVNQVSISIGADILKRNKRNASNRRVSPKKKKKTSDDQAVVNSDDPLAQPSEKSVDIDAAGPSTAPLPMSSKESTEDRIEDEGEASPEEDGGDEEITKFEYVCLKCIELKGQLSVAELKQKQWEDKFNAINEKCQVLEKEKEELKAEKLLLLNLGEKLSGKEKTTVSELKNLVKAVDLEPDYKDLQIADGMVYVGHGKTIKMDDILDADVHTSIGMKLKPLCKALWPEGIQRHTIKFTKSLRLDGVKIVTDTEISALKNILNHMTWLEDSHNVTEKDVRLALKHVISQARTDYLRDHPDTPSKKVLPSPSRKRSAKDSKENVVSKKSKQACSTQSDLTESDDEVSIEEKSDSDDENEGVSGDE